MKGLALACRVIETEPWRGELISDYRECALRWSRFLASRYAGEDFEPLVMTGLYMAAATYDPTRTRFLNWLKFKIRGSVSTILRNRRRRARGHLVPGRLPKDVIRRRGPPLIFRSLNPDLIDNRLFYMETTE